MSSQPSARAVGSRVCRLQLCSLFIPSSRGPLFPTFRACGSGGLPTQPRKPRTLSTCCPSASLPPPQLSAVASVYIEISYWPSTPFSPRYSRAATCLSLLQWYRPGLKSPPFRVVVSPKLQVLGAETPKGFPDLLAILVLEVCSLPNLADARTPTPPGPALTPGLMHRPSHPAPPRHGLTAPWARPAEPSCHAFLASASPVPSTHPRSRRGYPIRWARQSLSIFRCCCRNKDDLNLSQACFENAQSP